VKAVSLASLN